MLISCCRAHTTAWGDGAGLCWAGRAGKLLLPGFARHFPDECCYVLLALKTSSLRKLKKYMRRLRRNICIFNM